VDSLFGAPSLERLHSFQRRSPGGVDAPGNVKEPYMNRMTRRIGLLTLSAGVLLVNGPNPRGTAHAQTAEHNSATDSGESAQAKITLDCGERGC
jgi:hypothetical protein